MEGIGAEVSQKIRSAIKAKLMEIGVYVDEELPDYVMVMVANKRSKEQMDEDLELFLGKHTSLFTAWLHQVLQKLQEVTVASLGGTKRKSTDDSKKKKKSKQEGEKRVLKKKIKVEPEEGENIRTISLTEEDCDSRTSITTGDVKEYDSKEKADKLNLQDKEKEAKGSFHLQSNVQVEASTSSNVREKPSKTVEEQAAPRSHPRSISQSIDLDDEDCINIRTDGELLDTAEDLFIEESTKPSRERRESTSSKNEKNGSEKGQRPKSNSPHKRERPKSPIKQKAKLRSSDHEKSDQFSYKETAQKQNSPQISDNSNEKLLDARDLLNRKKAAKDTRNRGRSRSKERSISPLRKRRDEREPKRGYRDDRETGKWRDSDKDRTGRGDEKVRRRDREIYSSKRRESDNQSRRTDSDRTADMRENRRRDSSSEPPPKRVMLEKQSRSKNNPSDGSSTSRKRENEVLETRMTSRVVQRSPEPEDEVEAPVPSVVKVTPRPRRPASQQPSKTLILKAISEANKSLATIPLRPDSTQRARNETVFNRTLHQLERIPPKKIEISITNPLALQNGTSVMNVDSISSSPRYDVSARNKSPDITAEPSNIIDESKVGNLKQNETNMSPEIREKEEEEGDDEDDVESQGEDGKESVLEIEATPDIDNFDEPEEELSDPQFVVTLNGYDPDHLFSPSELDEGEEALEEEPLLTSTPDHVQSPRPKRARLASPIVIVKSPAKSEPVVQSNKSNLIEVELVKPKSTDRCKYWPACRHGEKCTFYHPTKPCKAFPACKFGDACLFIHPPCKFNVLCTRKDCVFAHTIAQTPSQPIVVPKAKVLYATGAPLPCRFYPNCVNINCQFAHPTRACRFGVHCTKKDCTYDHGQAVPIDKLKWTKAQTT